MQGAMKSIPSATVFNLLCRLLADYQICSQRPEHLSNSPILEDLRLELGEPEFVAFQKDLRWLMQRMPAAKAVGQIIQEAVQRKRAAIDANRARRINA